MGIMPEEAIEILEEVKAFDDSMYAYNLAYSEAIDLAIEALKAQEPVPPELDNLWKHTYGRCGVCRAPLPSIEGLASKFCWMCGRAVKWNG